MADSETALNFEQPNLVPKSMVSGVACSTVAAIVLFRYGHAGWAIGFSVGAALSMISFFSLGVLVPILTMPTAPRASQFLLALVFFLKLPLYTVALYAVTRVPSVDPRSIFPGIAVAPGVIGFHTIWFLIAQSARVQMHRRAIRRGGSRVRISVANKAPSLRVIHSESVSEQG